MHRFPHLLAPLVSDKMPRSHVVIDCEARFHRRGDVLEQRWLLGAAGRLIYQSPEQLTSPDIETFDSPADLWRYVLANTRKGSRTVVWAHNLAYDLRISRGLIELPAAGLPLRSIVVERRSAFAAFRGDRRSVTCFDLLSFIPAGLGAIAADLGSAQLGVAHRSASPDELRERCRSDVDITRQAVQQVLEMVHRERMGPLRQTGAGQAHAQWRRRFLTHRPLIHANERATEAERRAMWTGRCEAWRWGAISPGPSFEYDLTLAYPHIAAECELPLRLVGATGPLSPAQLDRNLRRYSVLAEVEVTTDRELVPAAYGELIHWPIGTFETTLWEPELRLLAEYGARVSVRRTWLYTRGPVLQAAATWLLSELVGVSGVASRLQRRALKHFARALVGRCALRYRSWEPYCQLPDDDLRLGVDENLATGERRDCLQVGRDVFTLSELVEAETSTPQLTGWVMSEARYRLWHLTTIAGADHVLYMDTDSLIVDAAGARELERAMKAGLAYTLAHKATHSRLRIAGPRNLLMGEGRRIAGVPLKATAMADGSLRGEVWHSLRQSLERGAGDSVSTVQRPFHPKAIDNRRDHLAGGATAPHAVR